MLSTGMTRPKFIVAPLLPFGTDFDVSNKAYGNIQPLVAGGYKLSGKPSELMVQEYLLVSYRFAIASRTTAQYGLRRRG